MKIGSGGTIDPGQSKGVTQANVTKEASPAGAYCIDGLNPAPRAAQVTPDYSAPFNVSVYTQISPTTTFCNGKQVSIRTYVNPATAADMAIYVALFD